MGNSTININFIFKIDGSVLQHFDMKIDSQTLTIIHNDPLDYPPWTKLKYKKCACCILTDKYSRCPAAVNFIPLVESFRLTKSTEKCRVTCSCGDRDISKNTDITEAIAYAALLSTAASDCPFMSLFKPLFISLPIFSTTEGATFNQSSLWLLGQYFFSKQKENIEINFQQFNECINGGFIILESLLDRIREANLCDGNINAFVQLDSYLQVISLELSEKLASLDIYFKSWIDGNHKILISETQKIAASL